MAGPIVQMDYAVVGDVAKGFTERSEQAKVIGQVTNTVISGLLMNPIVSMIIGPKLRAINNAVQQKTRDISKICDEFNRDLTQAIQDHKDGDFTGKHYFGLG